jgi:hypothetical protein
MVMCILMAAVEISWTYSGKENPSGFGWLEIFDGGVTQTQKRIRSN